MAIITNDTTTGEVFTGKPKRVSWERLWTFSGGPFAKVMDPKTKSIVGGWPASNLHTDLDFARSCGLPDKVAASATQFQGYVAQLMVELFGTEWLSHGVMDVKFIAIVDAGDTLVCNAVVQSKSVEGDTTRFTLDVNCENQRGEKVLVGWATGCTGTVAPQGLHEYDKHRAELMADSTIQHDTEGRLQLEPLEYLVTPELNQQFCYGQEDFHPRYIQETEARPPITHPALLLNWSNGTRSPSYQGAGPGGGRAGLHARDITFFLNPATVGKKLKVTWIGIGSYEKRGRPYSVGDTLIVDEDGLDIIRRLHFDTTASTEYSVKV
jgi:hypothetical protein